MRGKRINTETKKDIEESLKRVREQINGNKKIVS